MKSSYTKYSLSCLMALLFMQGSEALATETVVMNEITVTAPKETVRAALDPKSITNPYRVESSAAVGTQLITEKEIQAYAPKDIFDLLDKAAGLNVTYQGRRSPFSVARLIRCEERDMNTINHFVI